MNFVGRKTWKYIVAVRKWEMLAASKVKMSGSEKIKANMNTCKKIFGKHTCDNSSIKITCNLEVWRFRACLHGGGRPQAGEVKCGVSPRLSCKRYQNKMRDYMDGWVTPPKRGTSPTLGPSPPCKQVLSRTKRHCSRAKQRQRRCCRCKFVFC